MSYHYWSCGKKNKIMSIGVVIVNDITYKDAIKIVIGLLETQFKETPKKEILDFRQKIIMKQCHYRVYPLTSSTGFMSLRIANDNSFITSDVPLEIKQ